MAKDYGADALTHLKGLEAVRMRPGMYVGDTGSRGLTHLVFEIVDNAVDEALAGHATRVDVTIDGSTVSVVDDGRGIPVDTNKKSGKSGVELVFTELHAGGKFNADAYKVSGGLHGVGSSVVNALSESLDVTVWRDGYTWEVGFQRGITGVMKGTKFVPQPGIRKGSKTQKGHTGTRVVFTPDTTIFQPDAVLNIDAIRNRLKETAFLIPQLTLTLTHGDDTDTYHFDGGITDMIPTLGTGKPVSDVIMFTGDSSFTETVPTLKDGKLVTGDVTRDVDVEVGVQWVDGYDSVTRSFVNIVGTPYHGTHVKGAERALLATLRKQYEGTRILKAKEEPPILDDVLEGLRLVVAVKVPEPQFVGQTKDELGTTQVTKCVQTVVSTEFGKWCQTPKNKKTLKLVLEKVANAARVRKAARTQRDAARRKTALEGASMPSKLVDCRQAGKDDAELFLVEGDSALGSARQGRDGDNQALLPLRGKILNVQKASLADMLKNAECATMIQAIGAGSGRTFDVDAMRYERIILMTDADVDGAHIRTLLIAFFHKYMPQLIEQGHLFAAMPPLYKISTTGKNAEHVYAYSDTERDKIIAGLQKARKTIKTPIQRYKGLGEMNADELWDTTLNPNTRSLRRITLPDTAAALDMLELLMGDKVAPRKNYITDHHIAREKLDV